VIDPVPVETLPADLGSTLTADVVAISSEENLQIEALRVVGDQLASMVETGAFEAELLARTDLTSVKIGNVTSPRGQRRLRCGRWAL